jgi:TolB protein
MVDSTETINRTMNEKLFYGRHAEMAWLADQLDSGERLLVVYGLARIGKSALLHQLVRYLSGQSTHAYLAIYVDAGKVGGWGTESLLLQIAGEIGRCVRERTGIRITPPESAAFALDASQAWRAYLEQLAAQLGDRQPVLLIDNADCGAVDGAGQGNEWLQALLQAPWPVIVTAERQGSLDEVVPDLAIPPPSLSLGTLEGEAAESLIKALVSPTTPIDPWAVRRVVEITSHHPHYIRLFCRELLECCSFRSPLTPSDVEEALTFTLDAPLPEFQATWESLAPDEQFVLSSFGALRGMRGAATQYDIQTFCAHRGYSLSSSKIVATLNSLAEQGILEKLGANSYRFTLELYRLWVNHRRPPEYVLGKGGRRSGHAQITVRPSKLQRTVGRRPGVWMSVGVVLLVLVIVALQPVFWQGRANSRDTRASTPIVGTSSTRPASQTTAPPSAPTETLAPTPVVTLPGYDMASMARTGLDAPWQVYVLDSRTGQRVRLTETDSNERTPRWSPDGQRLVFASDRDGNRELYVIDLSVALSEGGDAGLTNLTQHKAPDWQPAWSPDGNRVAFSSHRDDNWEIYVVDADGSNLQRLTDHPENDFSPSWSPDGRQLVFASRRYADADLFSIEVETGELTQLTKGERNEFDPAWSPDGKWIAYVTQLGDQGDVYVMRADGADPINLTDSPYANDFQPTWSSDGQWVVYVSYSTAEGDHELYRMRPDGSEVTRLTNDEYDNLAPNWRPAAP